MGRVKRKRCGFTTSCACAKSHPSIYFPFKHSIVTNVLLADSENPDQTDEQADLVLRYPHMPEDKFLHGVSHITAKSATLPVQCKLQMPAFLSGPSFTAYIITIE